MFIPFRDDNPVRRTPWVTYALVAANVVAFLWLWRLPPGRQQAVVFQRGFVPARMEQLWGRNLRPLEVEVQGRPVLTPFGPAVQVQTYRLEPSPREILLSLITCMFLHGGWLHLLGNMWFLWIFGNNVEDRLGPGLYFAFYILGGLLATLAQWQIDPDSTTPIIGASGAVAAVLGAYAITWPWAKVETLVVLIVFFTVIELPALVVLGVWFLGQVVEATHAIQVGSGPLSYRSGVAWWAHIGGFIFGALAMPVLSSLAEPRGPAGRQTTTQWYVD